MCIRDRELVPPSIRGTVVAFLLLCLNMLGIVPGSQLMGMLSDNLISQGVENPYTLLLVGFSVMFLVLGPIFYYLAGKYYESDRNKLRAIFG